MKAGIYTVTLTASSSGCNTKKTATITVPEVGSATFTQNPPPYCQQEPINFSTVFFGNIKSTYFDFGGKKLFVHTSATTFEGNAPYDIDLTPTVTLTAQDEIGCISVTSSTFTVNGNRFNIATQPIITASNSNPFCEGDSVELSLSSTPASTNTPIAYLWSTIKSTPSIWAKRSGNYGVQMRDAVNCRQYLPPINVQAFPVYAPVIDGATTYCAGDSVHLYTFDHPYMAYSWIVNGALAPLISSRYDALLPSGTHSIQVEAFDVLTGCVDTSELLTVTVRAALPPPTITTAASQPYCEGEAFTFTAFSPAAIAYNWSGGQSAAAIIVNQPDDYVVTITDTAGCHSKDSVTINALPDFTDFMYGCYCFPLDEVNAPLLHGPTADTYQWYLNGSALAAPIGTVSTFKAQLGTIQLVATTAAGCTDTSKLLEVSEAPCQACSLTLSELELECEGKSDNGGYVFHFAMDATFGGTSPTPYFVTPLINGVAGGTITQTNLIGLVNGSKPLTGSLLLNQPDESATICFVVTALDANLQICYDTICAAMPTAICDITPDFTYTIDETTCITTFYNTSTHDPCTYTDSTHTTWDLTSNGITTNYQGNTISLPNLAGSYKVCINTLGYNYNNTSDCHPALCKKIDIDGQECNCSECEMDVLNQTVTGMTGNGCELSIALDIDNMTGSGTFVRGVSASGQVTGFTPTAIGSGLNSYVLTFLPFNQTINQTVCIKLYVEIEGEICCVEFCVDILACEGGGRKGNPNAIDINALDFSIVPNPASNLVNLLWQPFEQTDFITISVYSSQYELMYRQQVDNTSGSHEVNVSNWRNGMYLVQMESAHKRMSKRMLVVHD
ncbi:T9SS type A sorting domain-containing protein [bacterium]|nr:T9SS type A sorting domain-containing protein [bacterium]